MTTAWPPHEGRDSVTIMSQSSRAPFVPVIPAGGAGTRLWPLSRRDHPKFLLDVTGEGRSLLQETLDRLEPVADRPPMIVTGTGHRDEVFAQVGRRARVVAEPSPRNSMPAIALAAALIARDDADAVIGSFAADHLIGDTEGFARSVNAARAAAERGYLVTLGITPTHPSTGFGYIEAADRAGDIPRGAAGAPNEPADGPVGPARTQPHQASLPSLAGTGAVAVRRFVEKPDRATAEGFLATGRFHWNAGMFVVRAAVLLDALAEQIPSLAAGVRRIAATPEKERQTVLDEVWPRLTSIAIDHALAEPLAAQGRVAMVPASFDWDDVGDFAALARQIRARQAHAKAAQLPGGSAIAESDVAVLGGAHVAALDSRATIHSSSERLIALVGLDNITVVETDDVLLVVDDSAAQRVGELVGGLPELGREHLR